MTIDGEITWCSEGFGTCYPDAAPGVPIGSLIGSVWAPSADRSGVWTATSDRECGQGGRPPMVVVRERSAHGAAGYQLELLDADVDRLAGVLTAQARLERLLSVSTRLITATTVHEIGLIVCDEAIPAVGAFGGTMAFLEPESGELTVTAAVGYSSEIMDRWAGRPLRSDVPLSAAVRRNEPVWLPTLAARDSHFPALAGTDTGSRALCALPLRLDGPALGSIGFSFVEEHSFDRAERNFLLAVASQCAMAVERVGDARSAPTRQAPNSVVVLDGLDQTSTRAVRNVAKVVAADIPGIDVRDVVLVASEMVTNALLHTDGAVRVRMIAGPRSVRHRGRRHQPGAAHGRG